MSNEPEDHRVNLSEIDDDHEGRAPFEKKGNPNVTLEYPISDEWVNMRHLGA